MKRQIKLLFITMFGGGAYVLISQIYMFFVPLRGDLAWGGTLFGSYKLFVILLATSQFLVNFKNRKIKTIIIASLLLVFFIYWLPVLNYRPYRSLFMLLLGMFIYTLSYFYSNRRIHNIINKKL